MMRKATALASLFSCLLVLGASLVLAAPDELAGLLKEMQASREDFDLYVSSNVGSGSFTFPPACRQIPPARRAAVVRGVGKAVKAMTKTEPFLAWYASLREETKPKRPEGLKTAAEQRRDQIADLKKTIAEQQKLRDAAKGEARAAYDQAIAAMRQMLAELESADTSGDAEQDAAAAESNAEQRREHEQQLAAWDKEFPAGDPRPLLARRLKGFLDATAGVDFTAALVKREQRSVFKKPEYEAKDPTWKLAFRAGREATEAARAFAEEWLKELSKPEPPKPAKAPEPPKKT
jgi:hypothetical protein